MALRSSGEVMPFRVGLHAVAEVLTGESRGGLGEQEAPGASRGRERPAGSRRSVVLMEGFWPPVLRPCRPVIAPPPHSDLFWQRRVPPRRAPASLTLVHVVAIPTWRSLEK